MKPFPYQLQAVDSVESFGGRSLIAADMAEALPAVIICPASIKYHWEREAMKFLGVRSMILEGQTPSVSAALPAKIVIINYDILRFWVPWLRSLRPKSVVIDECHYAANGRAKRTKAIKNLCRGVKTVLALSGTPLVNRPIELWPILSLLRPSVFRSRWDFGQQFCGARYTPWGWDYRGASNIGELHRLLTQNGMVRLRKSDCLKDLPSKVRQIITLPIDRLGEYEAASNDFLGWLAKEDAAKARRASKAETMTRLSYLKMLAAKLKLRYVVGWINEWLEQSDGKLIVYCWHRKMVEALARRCGKNPLVIDGSVTGRNRQVMVDQFQIDKSRRLLIGNIQAAGTGLTLTAANTVVFAELTWRPGDHIQAEDRIHRIGTEGIAWCIYLVAAETIEERLCEVIQQKQKVLSRTLDGRPTSTDLNVYDELLKELRSQSIISKRKDI